MGEEGELFFQAEDGIRDVERSRGLGDVYKRQGFKVFKLFLKEANVEDCLISKGIEFH